MSKAYRAMWIGWRAVTALMFLALCWPTGAQSRVDQLLAEMTLEEKVGQMFMVDLYGLTLNEPGRLLLEEWKPGAAVLFSSNVGTPEQTTRLTNQWQSAVVGAGGVPMFISTDQEGGVIARLKDGFTTLPAMMLLTATGDVTLAQRTGETLARELSAVGVNMNLGPVADLYTNLRNPVIGRRSFGSEPERTGQILAGVVRGMQGGGVLATAKHFPGHGDTEHDSHTSLPIVAYSRDELDSIELAPFKWTIAAGVEAVMVAHIWYPAYDPDGQLPASLSYNVVTGLLREELGFTGLIMTDAIEMDAIDVTYSYAEASVLSILAGVDIVAFGASLSPQSQISAMRGVVAAVREGRIPQARIDESVRRILDAKLRYGILDWQPLDPATAPQRVNISAGAALVQELFNAGVTVAYDQSGAIPLDTGSKRISLIYPANRPAIRTQCERYGGELRWLGVGESPSDDDIARAVSVARESDLAVVFTSNAAFDPAQQALVRRLPTEKTVAVALFSPFDWQAFPGVTAYVTTYSPLPEAIPAACAVLFGAIPAQGRLPVALDGARDFVNGGAQLTDGGALSLLPRRTASPTEMIDSTAVAVVMFTPPVSVTPAPTLTPSLTPSITATFAPLDAVTRPPSTQAHTLTPSPQPTVIAAILPPTITPPNETTTPVGGIDMGMVALIGALIGGVGLVFVGMRQTVGRKVTRARATATESTHDIDISLMRCVVCGEPALAPQLGGKFIECRHCHSILRLQRNKKWVLSVNDHRYPNHRYNRKVFTESELWHIGRER